jgi:hypothetical protein
MGKKKRTKAERAEFRAFLDQMQVNAMRTRALAERAQAELDSKRSGK